MSMKWTCDREGNWRRVWVSVVEVNGRLVEVRQEQERSA